MSTTTNDPLQDRLERPVRDLRISVTDRCNFRCPYCMPAELFGDHYRFLPRKELLTFEEIERVAQVCAQLGVSKVRLTGGEPLVRAELEKLVVGLAGIAGVEDLALTTNGALLAQHAAPLRAAGLNRITVSLDSLSPATFRRMSGRDAEPQEVLDGIAAAEAAGFESIKINCVVQRGVNETDAIELARHFKGTGHIVRFIEFMDVGTLNGWNLEQVVPAHEIMELIGASMPIESVPAAYHGEVARRFRYRDGGGEIGVIASVTQPFCGSCTRARLTTDGKLVTCLFASGGFDLRELLRGDATDEELLTAVRSVWSARTDRYSEERTAATPREAGRIEMFQLGG